MHNQGYNNTGMKKGSPLGSSTGITSTPSTQTTTMTSTNNSSTPTSGFRASTNHVGRSSIQLCPSPPLQSRQIYKKCSVTSPDHPSPVHLIRRPHSSQEILLNSLHKQQNNKQFHSLSCQNSPSTPHPLTPLPVVQPRGTGTTMSSALRQVRGVSGHQEREPIGPSQQAAALRAPHRALPSTSLSSSASLLIAQPLPSPTPCSSAISAHQSSPAWPNGMAQPPPAGSSGSSRRASVVGSSIPIQMLNGSTTPASILYNQMLQGAARSGESISTGAGLHSMPSMPSMPSMSSITSLPSLPSLLFPPIPSNLETFQQKFLQTQQQSSRNIPENQMQMLLKNQFGLMPQLTPIPVRKPVPQPVHQPVPQPVPQPGKNDAELRDLLLKREMQMRDKLEASLMPHLSSFDREKFLPSLIGIGSSAPPPPILPMALADALAEQRKAHEMQALRAAGLTCDPIAGSSSSSSIGMRANLSNSSLNEAFLLQQHQILQQQANQIKANASAKQTIDSVLQMMNGLLRFCEMLRNLYDKQPSISLEPAGWQGLPPSPFTPTSVQAVCAAWNEKKKLIESKQALRNVEEHRKSEDSQAFGSYNATLLAFIAVQEKELETVKSQYVSLCQNLCDHLWVRFISDQMNAELFKYFSDQIRSLFDLGMPPDTPRSSPNTSKSLTPATPVPPVPTAPQACTPPQLISVPVPHSSTTTISSPQSHRHSIIKDCPSDEPSTSEEPAKRRRIEGINPIPSDPAASKKTETEKLSETMLAGLREVDKERDAYLSLRNKMEMILREKRRFMLDLQRFTQQRDSATNEKEKNEWEVKRREMEARIQQAEIEWINIGRQADGKGLMTKKFSQRDEERELLFKLDRLRQVVVDKNHENLNGEAHSKLGDRALTDGLSQTPQLSQQSPSKKHLLLRLVELMKIDARFRDLGMKTLQQIAITHLILMPELISGKISLSRFERGEGPLITPQMVSEFLGGSLEKDEVDTFARELSTVADCVLNDADVQMRMGYIMMRVNDEYHKQGQKDCVIPSEIPEERKGGDDEEDGEIDVEGDGEGEQGGVSPAFTEKFIHGAASS